MTRRPLDPGIAKAPLTRAGKAALLCVLGALFAGTAAAFWVAADWYIAYPPGAEATYVGSQRCAACHQAEHHAWLGSHHERAMALASPESVLGDFDDAEFTRFGVTSRFFTRGGKYFVNTEGPDGEHRDYEIKYTFGVDPLQQYMVEFPDGRVQVLRVSWDVHKKQWFEVPPPDAADERLLPGDPMHWTGVSQNWNHMCAECHSTNVHKNYDLDSDTYRTTFSEISVGCEQCHGPGSIHVELAESRSLFWDRNHGYGLARFKGADATNQIEMCATCHSHHERVHPDFRPGQRYLDHYSPVLLLSGLYHANGQIQDEVYEYGSFLQSKMHAKGIRCTDCHDPHSARLKFEGNRLCNQCHQPGVYDTFAHHRHPPNSAGAQCVSCHMPARVYMEIDSRRDHQFGVPRPDLSIELGTPNACNDCHTQEHETPAWAADHIRSWRSGGQTAEAKELHFAHAFAAAAAGDVGAEGQLLELVQRREIPAIVRATGLTMLASYDSRASRYERSKAIEDRDPLVRQAAVHSYAAEDPRATWRRLSPLLKDPVRSVRTSAARRLAVFTGRDLLKDERAALEAALEEYRQSQELALDRAASHLNLGQLAEDMGQPAAAEEHYRHAMRLEPAMVGPRALLARLIHARKEERAQEGALVKDLLPLQDEVRQLYRDEVEQLARSLELLPNQPFYWYEYGRLLYLTSRPDEAEQALEKACKLDPENYDYRLLLMLLYEKQRKWFAAMKSAEALVALRPADPVAQESFVRIRRASAAETD